MNAATKQTIRYLRERASFYGLRAKERHGTQADRDRAICRAYREDARALESDKVDNEGQE
ncbi:MAG: hypothetical protein EOP24_07905 [Hyphomicrobiales bacterium]|nr:MAG: hypothetical protein EOP24_07905 [Hyphomicrobiales bacterium]